MAKRERENQTQQIELSPTLFYAWRDGIVRIWVQVKAKGRYTSDDDAFQALLPYMHKACPGAPPDDVDWVYEVLTDPESIDLDQLKRVMARYPTTTPLLDALSALLKDLES